MLMPLFNLLLFIGIFYIYCCLCIICYPMYYPNEQSVALFVYDVLAAHLDFCTSSVLN